MLLKNWLRILLVTCALGVLWAGAAAAWYVGKGLYLDDYCSTRAPEPASSSVEWTGTASPAVMEGPRTIRCGYSDYDDVVVTDGSILSGTIAVVLLAGGLSAAVIASARRGPVRERLETPAPGGEPAARA